MLEGFSIKDEKAGIFSPPFFKKNAVLAMRDVQTVAQEQSSQLAKFPQDFALYYVCLFNEEDGNVEQATPHLVVTISALLNKEPTQ